MLVNCPECFKYQEIDLKITEDLDFYVECSFCKNEYLVKDNIEE